MPLKVLIIMLLGVIILGLKGDTNMAKNLNIDS